MTNHPSRNKPSRNALEMIAHFARHGIALDGAQQEAVATICRAGRVLQRLAVEECNGDWYIRTIDQDAWRAEIDRRRRGAKHRITAAVEYLEVEHIEYGGDPRGATVKLIMVPEWRRLHDSFGGDAYCVPGS